MDDIRAWHNSARAHLPCGLIYPCTIVPARYSGVYEGAPWVALPVGHWALGAEEFVGMDSDDVTCAEWWDEHTLHPIGRGSTPQAAYEDLREKLLKGPPTELR
jgi:hypothetical protein